MNMAISFLLLLFVSVFCYVVATEHECDSNSFPCDNGACISKWEWCDAITDCEDGSDEKYCLRATPGDADPNNCTENFFKCMNGECIPKIGFCDGIPSCVDYSDESRCDSTADSTVENFTSTQVEMQSSERVITDITEPISSYAVPTVQEAEPLHLPNELSDENAQMHTAATEHYKQSTIGVEKPSDFTELKPNKFKEERHNALEWLMSMVDENSGWGDNTPRALVAISLANPSFVHKKQESVLMLKQLHLQLSLALVRNDTKPVTLSNLALYINALIATCSNPRNFHGIDLIAILRDRANAAQNAGKFVTPSVYLTLCLGNVSTFEDVRKIHEIFSSRAPAMDKTDVQALATLAAMCMSKIPSYSKYSIILEAGRLLLQKVTSHGLPESVYDLGLLVQALNEARVNENWWNRTIAINMILDQKKANGSFGDILSTYYVLPVLSGRSLVSVGKLCGTKNTGLTPLEVLKNTKRPRIFVRYSLRFGHPVELTQSLQLRVATETSFFDIMRLASEIDPNFRFKYSMTRGVPTVYSIGDVANDAEKGMYWILHVASLQNGSQEYSHIPYTGDIRKYYPGEADDSVFWIKSLS